jgi:regulator of replication initiation timing
MGVARRVSVVQHQSPSVVSIHAHQHSTRRSMGFFSDLKKNIEEEVEKNKELKEALDKMKKKEGGVDAKAEPAEGSKESDEAMKAAKENLAKATSEPEVFAASLFMSC